jgi:hypothetical protein
MEMTFLAVTIEVGNDCGCECVGSAGASKLLNLESRLASTRSDLARDMESSSLGTYVYCVLLKWYYDFDYRQKLSI